MIEQRFRDMHQITPKVHRLHQYWLSLVRQQADATGFSDPTAPHLPPPRHLLDPGAILNLLPRVVIVEFEDDPFRVRYRLTGTWVDDTNGVNLTHAYLDSYDDGSSSEALSPLLQHYRLAWEKAAPSIFHYRWMSLRGSLLNVCCGIFPLTVDGRVRQAVALEEYDLTQRFDMPLPLRRR
jgi:hypothetical protein